MINILKNGSFANWKFSNPASATSGRPCFWQKDESTVGMYAATGCPYADVHSGSTAATITIPAGESVNIYQKIHNPYKYRGRALTLTAHHKLLSAVDPSQITVEARIGWGDRSDDSYYINADNGNSAGVNPTTSWGRVIACFDSDFAIANTMSIPESGYDFEARIYIENNDGDPAIILIDSVSMALEYKSSGHDYLGDQFDETHPPGSVIMLRGDQEAPEGYVEVTGISGKYIRAADDSGGAGVSRTPGYTGGVSDMRKHNHLTIPEPRTDNVFNADGGGNSCSRPWHGHSLTPARRTTEDYADHESHYTDTDTLSEEQDMESKYGISGTSSFSDSDDFMPEFLILRVFEKITGILSDGNAPADPHTTYSRHWE